MARETILDRLVTTIGFRADTKDVKKVDRAFGGLRKRLNSFSSATTSIGINLARAAGAGFALNRFKKFEKSFADMEGLVGINRKQLNAWKSGINDVSRELAILPGKAADAMFFITSAGFRGKAAMDVLRTSALGAAAGVGEVAAIADLLTGAKTIYKNLPISKAMDTVTATIREGKLDPQSLVAPMSSVLGLAGELGVSIDQVGTSFAALSKVNIKPQRAASQIRGIFAKMIKPSKMGLEVLEKIDLSHDKLLSMVRTQGLQKTLMTLNTAMGGDKNLMAKLFEDVEALQGVLNMLADPMGTLAMGQRIKDSTGDTKEALKAQMVTLDWWWKHFLAAVDRTATRIGQALAPVARAALQVAVTAINAWDSLPPVVKDLSAFVSTATLGLAAAGIAAAGLSTALSFIPVAFLARTGNMFKTIGAAIAGSGKSATMLARALTILPFVLSARFFTRLVGGLPLAFAGAAAGAGKLAHSLKYMPVVGLARVGKETKKSKSMLASLASSLLFLPGLGRRRVGLGVKRGLGGLAGVFGGIGRSLGRLGSKIMRFGKFARILSVQGALIYAAWKIAGEPIVGFFKGVLNGITEGSEATEKLSKTWEKFSLKSASVWSNIKTIFQKNSPVLSGYLSQLRKSIYGDSESLGRSWIDHLANSLTAAVDAATTLFGWLNKLTARAAFKGGGVLGDAVNFDPGATKMKRKNRYKGSVPKGLGAALGIDKAAERGRKFLPNSDAEIGPLSDLTHSGRQLVATFAAGVESNRGVIDQVFSRVFNPLPVGQAPARAFAGAGAGVGGQAVSVSINITDGAIQINAQDGDSREIAGKLGQELRQAVRATFEQLDSRVEL